MFTSGYTQAVAKERSFAVTADALRGFNVAVDERGIAPYRSSARTARSSRGFDVPRILLSPSGYCRDVSRGPTRSLIGVTPNWASLIWNNRCITNCKEIHSIVIKSIN